MGIAFEAFARSGFKTYPDREVKAILPEDFKSQNWTWTSAIIELRLISSEILGRFTHEVDASTALTEFNSWSFVWVLPGLKIGQ